MNDILVLCIARPWHIRLAISQRVANRMEARHELAIIADAKASAEDKAAADEAYRAAVDEFNRLRSGEAPADDQAAEAGSDSEGDAAEAGDDAAADGGSEGDAADREGDGAEAADEGESDASDEAEPTAEG